MEASPGNLFRALAEKRRAQRDASDSDKQQLFKKMADKRASGLQVLFKKLASQKEPSSSSSSTPRAVLTTGLVHEVAARQKLAADKEKEDKVKRRYRNVRRNALKSSRVKMSKSVSASRASRKRVEGLLSSKCRCCIEVCWSQFQVIMADLLALLTLFTEQTKLVRDEILQRCVGQSGVCVLGFRLCVTCFGVLFQLGKMPLQRFQSGDIHIDRRMKGKPRKPLPKVQDAKIRMYLSTVYCRSLTCFRALPFLQSKLNFCFCFELPKSYLKNGIAMNDIVSCTILT